MRLEDIRIGTRYRVVFNSVRHACHEIDINQPVKAVELRPTEWCQVVIDYVSLHGRVIRGFIAPENLEHTRIKWVHKSAKHARRRKRRKER